MRERDFYIDRRKILVALPKGMLEQVDVVAHLEHRTRSDLIREALRRYIEDFRRNNNTTIQFPQRPQE